MAEGIGGSGINNSSDVQLSDNSKLTAVRVLDVILDLSHPQAEELGYYDSIGTIFFSGLNEETSNTAENSRSAKPLFNFIKNYPLKNEIVCILSIPSKNRDSQTYYLPTVNVWNHPHHNALPPATIKDNPDVKQDYITSANGITYRAPADGSTGITLGNYFLEQSHIRPLLPYEGDSILEGRFGNSIRLGSTIKLPTNENDENEEQKTPPILNSWSNGDEAQGGDPIIIIRNGQSPTESDSWIPTLETVNEDDSSIYLTSNQVINNLSVASPHQQSYGAEELEPVNDILLDIPVPPIPEIIEEEEEEEEEIIQTTEEVIEEVESTTPTPAASTVVEPEEPEEEEDELSPFDELLEDGIYDDDFEDPEGDAAGNNLEGYDESLDEDGELILDGFEIEDNDDDYINNENTNNSSNNSNNNDNSGGGGNGEVDVSGDNPWNINKDDVADLKARGLVGEGAQQESKPTSYPCQLTSHRKPHKVFKLEEHLDYSVAKERIIAGKTNSKIKYLCVHTSAMAGTHIDLLYFFIKGRSEKVKLHTRAGYNAYASTNISKSDWKALGSEGQAEKAKELFFSITYPNGTYSGRQKEKKGEYEIYKQVGWSAPGYQLMIDVHGKCNSPILKGSGFKIGDDQLSFIGWGGVGSGNTYEQGYPGNGNTTSISWLPHKHNEGNVFNKKKYGDAGSKHPNGMTPAQGEAIKHLISAYVQKYRKIGIELSIMGHNNKSKKGCPGFHVQTLCKLMYKEDQERIQNGLQPLWHLKEANINYLLTSYSSAKSRKAWNWATKKYDQPGREYEPKSDDLKNTYSKAPYTTCAETIFKGGIPDVGDLGYIV